MNKTKVAVIRCESYSEKAVYEAVKRGINLIGGIDSIVKKGNKVLLKPNILTGSKPEDTVTTHPAVFNGIVKVLMEAGIAPSYGDSPAFEKPANSLAKAGIAGVAEKYGLKLGDFEKGKSVDFPSGMGAIKFDIANACLETDVLISLPKMKTHALARITGAVKNQFGCVYGMNKAAFHMKIPNPIQFCKMLVDINNFLKPKLFIMDGITAMEGNGPRGGDPVQMNCIIVSTDPVAVDSVFCRMIDLDPKFVPTNVYGRESGLGTYLFEELELVGDPVESFINKKFNVVRKPIGNDALRSFLPRILANAIYTRPVIEGSKCIKCGICVDACPTEGARRSGDKDVQSKACPTEGVRRSGDKDVQSKARPVAGKALQFKNGDKTRPPVYDYFKCIRCYCCQEVCPQKAITVFKPLLGRLLMGN